MIHFVYDFAFGALLGLGGITYNKPLFWVLVIMYALRKYL